MQLNGKDSSIMYLHFVEGDMIITLFERLMNALTSSILN
jgi:hypothetical protein